MKIKYLTALLLSLLCMARPCAAQERKAHPLFDDRPFCSLRRLGLCPNRNDPWVSPRLLALVQLFVNDMQIAQVGNMRFKLRVSLQ